CFFFSSRRRHTRSYGDWSSDVCSSDLHAARAFGGQQKAGSVPLAGAQCLLKLSRMVRRSAGDRPRLAVRREQNHTPQSESGREQRASEKGMRQKAEFSDILDRLSKGVRIPADARFPKKAD